jgi:hypothetical protein
MNKIYFFFLVWFSLVSCTGNIKKPENESSFVFPWNLNTNVYIQDIIDSVEFIALEDHPEGLFKKVDKLIVKDNKFFIFDMLGQNQVLVFDNTGHFLYKIGSKGLGPGEYVEIRNFTIYNDYVYLIDNRINKILIYNISNGTYVGNKEIPFIAHDMAIAENGDFIFTQQRIEGENPDKKYAYHIWITDINLNIKSKFFPFQNEDCGVWSQYCYLKTTDKHVVFHTMVADSVVLLNRYNPSDYIVYNMDFASKKVPRRLENDWELLQNYRFLTSTPEITSKYITGMYWQDSKIASTPYIYDMEKHEAYVNNYEAEDMSTYFYDPLFHDGNTIFSLYNSNYYSFWKHRSLNLPNHIRKHLDDGNDVLIKYILK